MTSDRNARGTFTCAYDDLPTPIIESPCLKTTQTPRATMAIDVEAMLEEIPGGLEMVLDLASLFLDECPSVLRQIREGLHDENPRLVRRGAHTLKSSASIFCARSMVDAASRLESLACEGRCAALKEPYYALERESDRVLDDLKRLCAAG